MMTNRGIGLLLALFLLGCGSSSSTKKIVDASATGRDGAAPEAAAPADGPAAPTETASAPDTTSRTDAAAPDGAPGVDGASPQDVPQTIDATPAVDQPSAADGAGQRLDGAGSVDSRPAIDAARSDGAGVDVGLSLPDVGLALPDVGIPDVGFTLPDLRNLLPDLAGGANCSNLAACCPNVVAALQTTCNNAVTAGTDSTCAALLATFTLAGYCP
jgi:hypothetical protein